MIASRRLGPPDQVEILDVGCGDALFFPELARFGRVSGIEVDPEAVDLANPWSDRIRHEPAGHPRHRDWLGTFDLITALDVLEHIADDRRTVRDLVAMLRPGGHLILTVPALPILWDQHDVLNAHHRRYTRRLLQDLLEHTDLIIERVDYLFASLVAPKLAMAWLNRFRSRAVPQDEIPAGWVNRLLERVLSWDAALGMRVRIPFGTSVLAIARRRNQSLSIDDPSENRPTPASRSSVSHQVSSARAPCPSK